jgi:hypothetical protein
MAYLAKVNPKRYVLSPKAPILLDIKDECFYNGHGRKFSFRDETISKVLRSSFYFMYKARRKPRWFRKLQYYIKRYTERPVSNVKRRLVRRIKGKNGVQDVRER